MGSGQIHIKEDRIMNMFNPIGILAREASVDRRIDDLIAKMVTPGWSEAETAEYHRLVAARTSSMRGRHRLGRRRNREAA